MKGTNDVRIDPELNNFLWHRGTTWAPTRIRLRLARRRNDEENAKEKLYTYVKVVQVPGNVKGLFTEVSVFL